MSFEDDIRGFIDFIIYIVLYFGGLLLIMAATIGLLIVIYHIIGYIGNSLFPL